MSGVAVIQVDSLEGPQIYECDRGLFLDWDRDGWHRSPRTRHGRTLTLMMSSHRKRFLFIGTEEEWGLWFDGGLVGSGHRTVGVQFDTRRQCEKGHSGSSTPRRGGRGRRRNSTSVSPWGRGPFRHGTGEFPRGGGVTDSTTSRNVGFFVTEPVGVVSVWGHRFDFVTVRRVPSPRTRRVLSVWWTRTRLCRATGDPFTTERFDKQSSTCRVPTPLYRVWCTVPLSRYSLESLERVWDPGTKGPRINQEITDSTTLWQEEPFFLVTTR